MMVSFYIFRRCLGNYDPFKQQKEQSFVECKNELKIVGMQIQEWIDQDESAKKVAMKNMFGNFLLVGFKHRLCVEKSL